MTDISYPHGEELLPSLHIDHRKYIQYFSRFVWCSIVISGSLTECLSHFVKVTEIKGIFKPD